MIQLEINGQLKKLVCDKSNTRLCVVSTDGDGFDADTIEELLQGAGIVSLSKMEGKDIDIAITITDS